MLQDSLLQAAPAICSWVGLQALDTTTTATCGASAMSAAAASSSDTETPVRHIMMAFGVLRRYCKLEPDGLASETVYNTGAADAD